MVRLLLLLSLGDLLFLLHFLLLLLIKSPKKSLGDIVFAVFLIKSPKQRLETYCFCSVSYYSYSSFPFFPRTMNLSTADLRNYWTEFRETWWNYRYMFLVDPKIFRFVVKGVKAIFLGGSKGLGVTIESYGKVEISYINVDNF